MTTLKKASFALLFSALGLTTLFTSCSKSNSPVLDDSINTSIVDDNSSKSIPGVTTIALNTSTLPGTWSVTYYFDKSNKTTKFNGYSLVFNANQTAQAIQGNVNTAGTWTTNASKTKLNLFFTGVKLLEEISEDWKVISQTASKIELIHVSGGNGGTDYLTLEK